MKALLKKNHNYIDNMLDSDTSYLEEQKIRSLESARRFIKNNGFAAGLFLASTAFDYATTQYNLSRFGIQGEVNPFLSYLFQRYGIGIHLPVQIGLASAVVLPSYLLDEPKITNRIFYLGAGLHGLAGLANIADTVLQQL